LKTVVIHYLFEKPGSASKFPAMSINSKKKKIIKQQEKNALTVTVIIMLETSW